MIRRAGKDPVQLDTRPLSQIMNDEIPYLKWAKQQEVIVRAGFKTWAELLKERYRAKT